MDYSEYSFEFDEGDGSGSGFSWGDVRGFLESSVEAELDRVRSEIESKKERLRDRREDLDRNISEIEEEIRHFEEVLEETYKPSGDEDKRLELKRLIGERMQERRYERRMYWRDVGRVLDEIEGLERELEELEDSSVEDLLEQ